MLFQSMSTEKKNRNNFDYLEVLKSTPISFSVITIAYKYGDDYRHILYPVELRTTVDILYIIYITVFDSLCSLW